MSATLDLKPMPVARDALPPAAATEGRRATTPARATVTSADASATIA
jgi:hypothetical protein